MNAFTKQSRTRSSFLTSSSKSRRSSRTKADEYCFFVPQISALKQALAFLHFLAVTRSLFAIYTFVHLVRRRKRERGKHGANLTSAATANQVFPSRVQYFTHTLPLQKITIIGVTSPEPKSVILSAINTLSPNAMLQN